MQGKHRKTVETILDLNPGEYVYRPGEGWYACTPNGMLANLSAHDCDYDKANDVLTVSPSILVRGGSEPGKEYHGYLEAGKWREC